MATIRFITRATKKDQPVSLYLRLKEGRNVDLTTILPLKVLSEYWSNKTGTFRQRIVFDEVFTEEGKKSIEDELDKLKVFVLNKVNEHLKLTLPFSKVWLGIVIDQFFNKVTEDNKPKETLNTYIDRFIREIKTGERFYNHNNKTKRYEKGSIKNFEGFKVQLDEYQKSNRVSLNFDSITVDFYDEFVKYFMKKNYSTNTIGRHIKNLKTIMRCAREEGLHENKEIERKKFKSLKEPVQNIYLTQKEVDLLYNADLSDKPVAAKYRDVFLIGCYTAQRFSDFSRIRPENIREVNDSKLIDLIQKKTGERVIIPIRPELETILQRYNYHVPKTFEQKVNESIKDIARDLGITELVEIEQTKGGLKVSTTVAKCDLIKTHTARRTGCTLMYLAGIPTLDIMKVSGHKTEREFLNYIKVGKEETANKLAMHPYFSGVKLKVI